MSTRIDTGTEIDIHACAFGDAGLCLRLEAWVAYRFTSIKIPRAGLVFAVLAEAVALGYAAIAVEAALVSVIVSKCT